MEIIISYISPNTILTNLQQVQESSKPLIEEPKAVVCVALHSLEQFKRIAEASDARWKILGVIHCLN